MKRENKIIIDDFKLKSRPVDLVNYIMQEEILSELKKITTELKKLNKDRS